MQQKKLFSEQAIEIGAACDRDIEMKVRILNSLLCLRAHLLVFTEIKKCIKRESTQSYVKFKTHIFFFSQLPASHFPEKHTRKK
jgi:hypothetical protein